MHDMKFAVILAAVVGAAVAQDCVDDQRVIQQIFQDYDRNVRPGGDEPTHIQVSTWLQDISSFDAVTSSIDVSMYFSQLWHDERLSFEQFRPCSTNISSSHLIDMVWNPNTHFLRTSKASITSGPSKAAFVLIYSNGTVWINHHMRVSPTCKSLSVSPFDRLLCKTSIESYTANVAHINYHWADQDEDGEAIDGAKPGVMWLGKPSITEFTYLGEKHTRSVPSYPAGRWSNLDLCFALERPATTFFRKIFLPQAVLTLLAIAATALGVSSLSARALTITLAFVGVLVLYAFNAPSAPTFTWIDTWTAGCVVALALSYILLLLVVWRGRREGKPVEVTAEFRALDWSGMLAILAFFVVFLVLFAIVAPLWAHVDPMSQCADAK